MAAELKTRQTDASVEAYLDAIDDDQRRADCRAIAAMMQRVTRQPPKMWGPSIVGFGSYHYKYASGHEGDACLTGFSSRQTDISIYIVSGFESHEQLLSEIGKCKTAKACLYVKRLSDINPKALETLIKASVAEMQQRYPD